MADVFKSQEVYKHVNYDLHDRNEMIAVRGVYVTGEYRPPYYNNPILALTYIRGVDCTVANFKTEYADVINGETVGMYKIDTIPIEYAIHRYSTESVNLSSTDTVGMYKINIEDIDYYIDRYGKEYINVSSTDTVGMYQINISNADFSIIKCPSLHKNSTPEYGLGLSFIRTDSAIIENYIP